MRIINCVMLLNSLVSVSPCTFPSYMTGTWSDSKFYDVQFSGGTHMYLSEYSISRKGTTTNLTCYMKEDNKYVARTTESVTATISGISGQYYYYLCMEVTQITDYSFYYYLQSDEDTNNERTIAVIADTSNNSISTFCQTPISLQQFHIMVKNGHELEALQTCSTPMLGAFQFELSSTDFCTSETNSGNWAYDSGDETFSSLNITYSTTSCSVKVGHSENSNVGCLLCIQTDDTYITSIINLDSNIDDQLYYKFTCMITRTGGDNVTISQRARVCHKDQTADTMPDTTKLHPKDSFVIGAVLYLVPNGNAISKEANCFPKPESTSSSPESSSKTVVIAVILVVILLLIIVGIAAFIYCWKKVKGRVRVKNQALPRKRGIIFDIRTALTVGMGSSRKREKSFVQQNGSDILIVHKNVEDKLTTGETEINNSETSPVSASSGSHCDEKKHGSNGTLLSTIEKGSSLLQGSETERSANSEITSISVVQITTNSSPELIENMKSSNDSIDNLQTTTVEPIISLAQQNDSEEGANKSQSTKTSEVKTYENTLPSPELQRLPTQDQIKNGIRSTDNNDTLPTTMVEQILPFSQEGRDEKGSEHSKNTSTSVEKTFEKALPAPELQTVRAQDQIINAKSSNDNNDTLPSTVVEPILHFSQQEHDEKGSDNLKNTIKSVEIMAFENVSPPPELQTSSTQNQNETVNSSNDYSDTLPTTMVEQIVPLSQQGGEKGNNISENNTTSVVHAFENTLTSPEFQGIPKSDKIQNTKRFNENSNTVHTTMVEQSVPFTKQRNKEGDGNSQIEEISSKDLTFENSLQAPTNDQIKMVNSSNTTTNLPFRSSFDAKNNQSQTIDEEVVTKNYSEIMTNEPQNSLVTEKLKPLDSNNGNERLRDIENRDMQFDQRLTNSAEKANIKVYVKDTSINKKQPQHTDSNNKNMNMDYSDTNDCGAIASSNQPTLTLVKDTNNHKNDDLTIIHRNVGEKPKKLSQQPTIESHSDQTVTAHGNDVKDRRNQKTESNGVLSFRTETMRKTGDYIWNIETKPHFIKSTISLDQTQEVKKSSIANQSLQNLKKKKVRKELLKKKSPYNSITFIRK